jgi:ABC-type multidrug transport system permease subunit
MSRNPITLVRAAGNLALVLALIGALVALFLQAPDVWDGWKWVFLAVALTYAAASFVVNLLYADRAAEAWDEQNTAAHRDSLVFGYWAALAVFLVLLALVWTDRMEDAHAIFWMGPVFALAPPLHYLVSILRGRAE